MSDTPQEVVREFEAEALRAVAAGGDASGIDKARDQALDQLRDAKAGADRETLEAIFEAALEIETKADLAKKTITE